MGATGPRGHHGAWPGGRHTQKHRRHQATRKGPGFRTGVSEYQALPTRSGLPQRLGFGNHPSGFWMGGSLGVRPFIAHLVWAVG